MLQKLSSPPWPDSCWDQLFSFQYGVLRFPEFPEDGDLGQIHASTFKDYWSVKRDLPLPCPVLSICSQGYRLFVTGEMALARCTHSQIQNLVVYLLSGGREIWYVFTEILLVGNWILICKQLSHFQASDLQCTVKKERSLVVIRCKRTLFFSRA